MKAPALVEHFFRHEYGKLTAILTRQIGMQHLEDVEDAVQSALMSAIVTWPLTEQPDNPSAWLYRTARNNVMGVLRQRSNRIRIMGEQFSEEFSYAEDDEVVFLEGEVRDDLLRMLFVCCDESIPVESQLVTALKILCGFSVQEIALRLFISTENVYKRLTRARSRLKESLTLSVDLSSTQYRSRLPVVHKILYLLFTEGYLSSHADQAIRRELCHEALRLTTILAEHPVGEDPETFALLSLIHLHSARIDARQDGSGGLLLLEEQDRSKWNKEQIGVGLEWLARSAHGDRFSRYHAEAGIAAEHVLAPSYRETRWERIADHYLLLETMSPSALHRLNRSIAVAESEGASYGLSVLEGFTPPEWLACSYQWSAVLADLHRRAGDADLADRYRESAIRSAPSTQIQDLLRRRLGAG